MHAARAIKANREKAKDPKLKLETRRPSASSHESRIPRSPAVSLDTKKVHPHTDDSDNLNFSYAGFLIAVFGAVPLIVGTFIEVPALWEIGLGVTLVGLFIGVVFWCTELCAEAKKFSQKKNQLSTRGKIEDSNLLQVPERKFQNGNGVESRRSSFQSDSVSLITPMAQSFGSPKHLPHLHHNVTLDSKHSISQYSSSEFYSKSDESSATLSFSLKANGHLGSFPQPPPPPKLLLRGTRKDDSRVVSLVQPDPGLEDDSDSDAETVIEAPTGKPKIIQVQTLQEKRQSGVVLSVSGHSLMDPDAAFHLENETVPPLVPLAQQHRTIRMPVMPQEVDKLQRCECGRYLLTERDKLVGVRLPGIAGGGGGGGGSSMPATTYNSPSLAGVPTAGAGTAPATRKVFTKGPPGSLGISNTPDSGSTNSSVNDISSSNAADNKIIIDSSEGGKTLRQTSASSTSSRKSNDKVSIIKSTPMPHPSHPGSALTRGESVVQVEPTVISSDLLVTGNKTESVGSEDEMGSGDPIVSTSPGGKTLRKLKRLESLTNVEVEDKDRVLEELLELTDVDNDNDGEEETPSQRSSETQNMDDVRQQIGDEEDDDDEFVIPSKPHPQGDSQQRSNSANRPTSLALPIVLSDPKLMTHQSKADDPNDSELGPGLIVSSASSASSASTVVFIGEQGPLVEKPMEEAESIQEQRGNDGEPSEAPALPKEMSLDELLDKLEEKEDGEVLAVVVQ